MNRRSTIVYMHPLAPPCCTNLNDSVPTAMNEFDFDITRACTSILANGVLHKYPNIKINTGYSFGLDDQEFVLAFEGDDPAEFLALVEELRSTEASAYTELETPIFTCVRTDATQLLRLLG